MVTCESALTTTFTCGAQAVFFDIPTRAAQDAVTRGREAGEVRHLAAGDETDARLARQTGELEHVLARDIFDDGDQRRGRVDAGVLVPRADQPVRAEGDGIAAADDEAEVTRAGAADGAALGVVCDGVEDDVRLFAGVAERDAQCGQQFVARGARTDVALGQIAEKALGVIVSAAEETGIENHGLQHSDTLHQRQV